MWAVAHEGPFPFRVGVAHLDALDQDPMPLLALVDRQNVVRPGVARPLHPAPDRGALLARKAHEALLQLHGVAEGGARGLALFGIGAADHGLPVRANLPQAADLGLDPAHREPGERRDHVGTAESYPAGVVADLVETRGQAHNVIQLVVHDEASRPSFVVKGSLPAAY